MRMAKQYNLSLPQRQSRAKESLWNLKEKMAHTATTAPTTRM